jgi:hypothetical protein
VADVLHPAPVLDAAANELRRLLTLGWHPRWIVRNARLWWYSRRHPAYHAGQLAEQRHLLDPPPVVVPGE